jgi:hypothetical protein
MRLESNPARPTDSALQDKARGTRAFRSVSTPRRVRELADAGPVPHTDARPRPRRCFTTFRLGSKR